MSSPRAGGSENFGLANGDDVLVRSNERMLHWYFDHRAAIEAATCP